MSGAIFAPLEGPDALDAASGHPLVCPLCHAQYERPCLLDCFHHFCAGCLRGCAAEGRLTCPLCQHQTVVKGPGGIPPVDRLLQFLVDSSGDGLEVVRCANCDLACSEQDSETTYFCNTCGQPLCAHCREETHRARMFARHDIVALGQRSRDVLQKCTLHTEPYIMFSTDKKSLLCIRCFRDMQGESRAHCVDLESAYVQGCEQLEQAVLSVKALQTATREAIALLQARVEEVRCSAAEEEAAIHSLFGSMQDKLAERKALLLQAVQSQYEEKDKAFKEQLSHLATLLPTLQVHLVICSSFLSLANKAQFLDLGYVSPPAPLGSPLPSRNPLGALEMATFKSGSLSPRGTPSSTNSVEASQLWPQLCVGHSKGQQSPGGNELIERLQGITTQPHRLQPAQSSQIISDHRAEFSRCLEPLLLLPPGPPHQAAGAGGGTNTLAGGSGPKGLGVPSCPSPLGKMLGPPVQKPTLHRSISTKVLLAEGEDTPFMEHCRHFEDSYRHLQAETQSLKDQVQELHRDLTKHHSLIKAEIMGDILHKALQVDAQIAMQYASVEGLRAVFQEMWEESIRRVASEQQIYEAQLHDLVRLKQENACLTAITEHITPYVRSIAKVKERLVPRFQAPVDEESEHLQNVRDDGTGDETQARGDLVCTMDERELTSELRGSGHTLNSLPEEPAPKNKDPHRPKLKTGGDGPPRREHPT